MDAETEYAASVCHCKFFEVIVTEIVKVIVMPRTKRGKILFDEKVKGSLLPPLPGHMCRRAPCGSEVKGQCQVIKSLVPPKNLHSEIHLGWGAHAHSRLPGQARCGKWNQITCLKEDEDPKELAQMVSSPLVLLFCTRRGCPYLFSPGCFCLN